MKRLWGGLLLLPLLAACSGGGADVAPSQLQTQSQLEAPKTTEAQSDTISRTTSSSVPSSADLLYVSNQGNQSITVYAHDQSNNSAPKYVIEGPNTGIVSPGQLSEDAQGNLYVANGQSVLIFAHGASGNIAPIRKLAGPSTGFNAVRALTVDRRTGKLFVMDTINGDFAAESSILRFAPNATGDEAPFARSAIQNYIEPIELANDSTGNSILESYYGAGMSMGILPSGVGTYAKQFADGAISSQSYNNVFYLRNEGLGGVADDPTTKTYVLATPSGIERFRESATGSPAPISTITGAAGCSQLTLGYLRNIYAVCGNAIDVYEHDVSGNAKPIRTLTGSATKLNTAYGIYEGQ